MDAESKNTGLGLIDSLKNLTTTLVSLLYNRLDLLSTDLEEARQRLLSLLVLAFLSLFCLCLGMVLLTMLVVVAFWDSHRLLTLCSLTVAFLLSGSVLCAITLRALHMMPRIFAASLTELSKDQEALEA